MTGQEMQDFNTELLGGNTIDDTFFYQLLNAQKGNLEAMRDWMILRAFDSSISVTSSDTYLSTKTLPARFSRLYTPYDGLNGMQPAVSIIESNGTRFALNPIPLARRYEYKDLDGYYYLDIKNGTIGRTGTKAGTLHLHYIQNTADIAADSTWEFPSWSHSYLPTKVAITNKGGIDWDTVNSNQVGANTADAQETLSRLCMWDAQLQQQEIGV